MRSILSIILIAALLLSFIACSGNEEKTPSAGTTTPSTTEPQNAITYEQDNLPDTLDFGGDKVIFLTYESKNVEDE